MAETTKKKFDVGDLVSIRGLSCPKLAIVSFEGEHVALAGFTREDQPIWFPRVAVSVLEPPKPRKAAFA